MNAYRTTVLCTASFAAAIAALPVAAQAQSASSAQETASSTDIVVTATRREERAVDVPIAVSSLSGEKLAVINSSGQDIRFLSGRVPSLLAESSFGRTFPRFYIRGLGNTDFSSDAAQPVSVVYDNIALESPFLKAMPAFDLENVEVLKGPQGTLFGRNTPAGVIKLTSARPTDHYTGHASASWGTYNTVNSEVALSGPITDTLRFRVAGLLQHRDDWVKNDYAQTLNEHSFDGYNDMAGRALLEYDSGPLNVLVNLHGRRLRGSARVFRGNSIKPGTNDFVDGFDVEHTAQNGANPQRLNSWGTNVQASYAFDGLGTLFSITGWERASVFSRGDVDGSYPAAVPFSVETGSSAKPREFTQEVRFASEKFGDVSFQTGAYYFNQNLDTGAYSWDTTNVQTNGNTSHLDNETYAVFGSVEYTPIDALILRGGLRWSHDRKYSELNNVNGVLLSDGHAKGSKLSWDASATYKLDTDHSVYARAASGYLGASLKNDVTAGVATKAKPQTTTSFEAGFKGNERGLVSYSADVFYMNTRNIQLTAVGGSSNTTTLINAHKAIGWGVEGEMTLTPVEGLALTAGGSYNFTKLKDRDLMVAPCSGGCTVLDPVVSGTSFVSIDGNRLPQAPRWIANWTASYTIPVSDTQEVFAYTDWAYRSSVNLFLYDSIEFTGKPSLEGGLRLGFRDNAKGVEVAAFARNITNQIRIIGAIDFNNLTSMVNEPRIIGGEVKFKF
ncbi:TonB-dependent receptor [Novosphingobium clariflavum]|uniref:TonB-dependent receptor n=1 Tax=Novosphingobium clariflavum TaxID=2029884 RepID=A0ABV6SCC5_9SPHN|nr:TonB-dependent receptor [Novosphingobium clariflavum]